MNNPTATDNNPIPTESWYYMMENQPGPQGPLVRRIVRIEVLAEPVFHGMNSSMNRDKGVWVHQEGCSPQLAGHFFTNTNGSWWEGLRFVRIDLDALAAPAPAPVAPPDTMLAKWALVHKDHGIIDEFWDWLCEHLDGYAGDYLPGVPIREKLDEYFGIDRKQLERERRALLQEIRP